MRGTLSKAEPVKSNVSSLCRDDPTVLVGSFFRNTIPREEGCGHHTLVQRRGWW
jgi:hypothetical protein